jgi:hypothetical protein
MIIDFGPPLCCQAENGVDNPCRLSSESNQNSDFQPHICQVPLFVPIDPTVEPTSHPTPQSFPEAVMDTEKDRFKPQAGHATTRAAPRAGRLPPLPRGEAVKSR